eukprot:gene2352-3181_t
MPRVVWSHRALTDLDRLEAFLHHKNPRAAIEAIDAIYGSARRLADTPEIGRPARLGLRELLVRFSNGGYLVLYAVDPEVVQIVRVRHQREAGALNSQPRSCPETAQCDSATSRSRLKQSGSFMTRVLIVDDDPVQLRLTAEVARRAGFAPVTANGGDEALRLLRADPGYGAMILDLVMPDTDGMAVLEAMARNGTSVPVIVQTAHSSLDTVVSAMRQGAVDFFVKPVAPERLIVSLRNVMKLGELETIVRTERARRAGTLGLADIVTGSPNMHRVLTLCQKAAK